MENTFYISTDKSQLDVDVIFDYLSNHFYWAKGRSREAVKKWCLGTRDAHGLYEKFGFRHLSKPENRMEFEVISSPLH